jgi:hypothetical protein
MTITPKCSGSGSVVILHWCEVILPIPIRTVGNSMTSALIAMLNMLPTCRVSVVPRARRRPPATMIRAPIPVPGCPITGHGEIRPGEVFGKSPCISQTAKIIHGVRITTIPIRTRNAPIPFTILSELIVTCMFKIKLFNRSPRNNHHRSTSKKEKTMMIRLNRSRIVLLNRLCSLLDFFMVSFQILYNVAIYIY